MFPIRQSHDIAEIEHFTNLSSGGSDPRALEYTQLESGSSSFSCRTTTNEFGQSFPLVLSRQKHSHRVHIAGAISCRSYGFIVPLGPEGVRCNGADVPSGNIAMLSPGGWADLVTFGGAEFLECIVEPVTARRLLERLVSESDVARTGPRLFRVPNGVRSLQIAGRDSFALGCRGKAGVELRNSEVLDGLRGLLENAIPVARSGKKRFIGRFRSARLAMNHLRRVHDRSVSSAELCAVTEANLRSLELGFAELFGAPPRRWHKAYRLRFCRKALREAHAASSNVTRVAADHGFSHLGRFALEYKEFFGESPSATLRATGPTLRGSALRVPDLETPWVEAQESA